jgi:hypothetical protein
MANIPLAFAIIRYEHLRNLPEGTVGTQLPAALFAQSPMSDVIAAWSHW